MSEIIDFRIFLIAGIGIFLIVLCSIALKIGKIIGPWWTAETVRKMFWPGGKIYKKDEYPRAYWFLVVFYYILGFLCLFFVYWAFTHFY